jgi:hypothetical protein
MTHSKIVPTQATFVVFCFKKKLQICETVFAKLTRKSLKSNENKANRILSQTKIKIDGVQATVAGFQIKKDSKL